MVSTTLGSNTVPAQTPGLTPTSQGATDIGTARNTAVAPKPMKPGVAVIAAVGVVAIYFAMA